jgi:hypothetical protein
LPNFLEESLLAIYFSQQDEFCSDIARRAFGFCRISLASNEQKVWKSFAYGCWKVIEKIQYKPFNNIFRLRDINYTIGGCLLFLALVTSSSTIGPRKGRTIKKFKGLHLPISNKKIGD